MNALSLLHDLEERGMACQMDDQGRLIVKPSRLLNDDDRANIRAHLPTLKRLVSCDYTQHLDGWSVDPDMPNRAVHVRQGRLLDSCLFRTTTGAVELVRRLALGEPQTLAFYAACAFEDEKPTTMGEPSR